MLTELAPAATDRQPRHEQQQAEAGEAAGEGEIQPAAVAADHAAVAVGLLDGAAEGIAAETEPERLPGDCRHGAVRPGGTHVGGLFEDRARGSRRLQGRVGVQPVAAGRIPANRRRLCKAAPARVQRQGHPAQSRHGEQQEHEARPAAGHQGRRQQQQNQTDQGAVAHPHGEVGNQRQTQCDPARPGGEHRIAGSRREPFGEQQGEQETVQAAVVVALAEGHDPFRAVAHGAGGGQQPELPGEHPQHVRQQRGDHGAQRETGLQAGRGSRRQRRDQQRNDPVAAQVVQRKSRRWRYGERMNDEPGRGRCQPPGCRSQLRR